MGITSVVPSLNPSWLQRHERLILGTMVLAVALYGCNRWFDKTAADANAKAAAAAMVAASADASKKQADVTYAQVLTQANAQTALLQTQVASDKQTIASLVATIASRDAASNSKVAQVSGTKTPPQAVADLSTAYTLAAPVVVTDSGAVVPTVDLQQFTVAKIEGDSAKSDLKDSQDALAIEHDVQVSLNQIITDKETIISADAVTLAAHDTAAKADTKKLSDDLAAAKSDARKSKLHWFVTGVLVGLGIRSVK